MQTVDVVDDLSIMLVAGRVRTPRAALQEARDAERLGISRALVSERFDLKEVGALLGGVGAVTDTIEFGTAALAVGSRHPLVTAALGATMQTMYGPRFVLGLGRSDAAHLADQGMQEASFSALVDYASIIRRLWAGETVTYEGELGRFDGMRMADPLEGPPPQIWSIILGGPRASRVAARFADGVLLTPFLTPEAVSNTVGWIREERERVGLDPASIRISHPIVTVPDADEEWTLNQTAGRFVGYIASGPTNIRIYGNYNGWNKDTMRRICAHPVFRAVAASQTADRAFTRAQTLDAARDVPAAWMRETCAIGSVADCVNKLETYRQAGVDEITIYGTPPAENAELIKAWRARLTASRT
ncbi:MAG: TIGR03857 family LLM class F420-dependent oxidoreductase [Solirubrobacteraceae bacterium]